MGIENSTCNNCGGKLEVSRYIEGSSIYKRAVVKFRCCKCKNEGSSSSARPHIDLPEWSQVPNGKPLRKLA